MREINIDLSNLDPQYDCGHCGEANTTNLNIDVSALQEGASFLVVVFKNGYAETYCSERFYTSEMDNDTISVPLWDKLTKTQKEIAVVEAYTEAENGDLTILAKSNKINLYFENSISSDDVIFDDRVEGLYKELIALETKLNSGIDVLAAQLTLVKTVVDNATTASSLANKAVSETQSLVDDISERLNKGEFKGEPGEKGEKGEPGKDAEPITVDGNLSENSDNAIANSAVTKELTQIKSAIGTIQTRNLFDTPDGYENNSSAGISLKSSDNLYTISVPEKEYKNAGSLITDSFTVARDGTYTVTVYADTKYLNADGMSVFNAYVREKGTARNLTSYFSFYSGSSNSRQVELAAGVEYVLFMTANKDSLNAAAGTTFNFKVQVEEGETLTEWQSPRTELNRIYEMNENIDKVSKRVSAVESRQAYLPDYAVEEKTRVLAQLYDKMQLNNPIIIGFHTDQHIKIGTYNETATRYALETLSELTRAIPFDFVVLGGDEPYSADTEMSAILKDVLTVAEPIADVNCPLISLPGNHDAFQNNSDVTMQQVFSVHTKRNTANNYQNYFVDYATCNSYCDDAVRKIRYIFLNTNSNTYQGYTLTMIRDWLENTLREMPDEYNTIIMSHHPLNPDLSTSARDCTSRLNKYADKIICCISGHTHRDDSVMSEEGILYVTTTNAGFITGEDGWERKQGMPTETAYDIFVIDTQNRKMYAVRYGAGENREWNY